jgi:Zn-dependent alcohol dehydrogenase
MNVLTDDEIITFKLQNKKCENCAVGFEDCCKQMESYLEHGNWRGCRFHKTRKEYKKWLDEHYIGHGYEP